MALDDAHRFKISEEAASWLFRLAEDASQECQAEFTAWSLQSPQHVEEFLFAKATLQQLKSVDPERRIDLRALDAAGQVLPFAQDMSARSNTQRPKSALKPGRRHLTIGLAAGVALLFVAAGALEL